MEDSGLIRYSTQQPRSGRGEAVGAPRGRGLPLEPQTPALSAGTEIAPRASDNRKGPGQPDLREFISGFVKYLNGNVPMGTGMPRPIRNRINNRGPPKISDLPPLNLDSGLPPALQPPPPPTDRDPPPYPFEKPIIPPEKHIIKPFISGVPLPEQLVPTDQSVLPSSIPASLRPPLRPVRPKPNEKYENKTKIYGDQNRPYPDLTNTPDKPPVKLEPPREPARPFYEGPKQSTKPPLSNPNKNVNLSYAPTPSRTPIVQREEVTNGTTNPPINQAFNTTQSPSSSNSSSTEKPKISATKVLGVDVSSVVNVVTEKIPDKETELNVSTTEPGPVKGNSNATTTTSTTSTAGNSTTRMPATSPNNASTETTTRSDFTTVTTPKLGNIANTDRPASSPSLPVSGLTAIPSVTRVRPAIIESSIIEEVPLQDVHKPTKWEQGPMAQKPYKGGGFAPRPGIVLDDPEYKPGGGRPIITAPPKGEIFDVTVSAMESAMSMTPFSDAFMGAKLNNIFTMPGASHKPVFVNMTLQIEESLESKRPQVKQEIQKQLLGAIHRRSNNIGTSPLWAVPANSVSALQESERNILRCGLRTEQRPICDDETSGSDSTQHVHHGSFSLLPNMIIYITPEDTKKKFQHLQTTNRPSNPGAYSLLLCNAKTTTKNWTIERLVY
ncbi:unnamed protein product [Nesidiocoris tenuis]|uniref:Uncharacterized protein n=1 Tax=Nesidiocoris tenuis TaxID=355587 RepID=A0A6H5HPK6_9HEMI|nr:unnamed protein product [Nesidiocoris tenuis]